MFDITELLKNKTSRTSGLILLLFFFMPVGFIDVTNAILIILLIHSFVVLKKQDWITAFKNKAFWMVGGYFVLHALNVIRVSDVPQGLIQLEIKAPFFLAALLIVANQKWYKKDLKEKALKRFVLGAVCISVLALLNASYNAITAQSWFFISDAGNQVSYFTYVELTRNFMHPGYFSTFVGFAIFISIDQIFKSKEGSRMKEIIILIFLLLMMFLLQGRMNIIALVAVFALGGAYYAFKHKMYKTLAIPALAAVVLVAVLFMGSNKSENRFLQMPDFSYDITGDQFNSATYRLAEWTCAADVIKENFWIGVGVGDNRKALIDAYQKRGFKKGVEHAFNAHNQYLETMLATGIVGLLYLLFMLFAYGRWALKTEDYTTLACLLFLSFSMLTESMFERSWAITLFAVFFPFMMITGNNGFKQVE